MGGYALGWGALATIFTHEDKGPFWTNEATPLWSNMLIQVPKYKPGGLTMVYQETVKL